MYSARRAVRQETKMSVKVVVGCLLSLLGGGAQCEATSTGAVWRITRQRGAKGWCACRAVIDRDEHGKVCNAN